MIGHIVLYALLAGIILSTVLNARKLGPGTYFVNLLVGIDQFINSLLGGKPQETISARCSRGFGRMWYWTLLGRFLNWIKPGHIKPPALDAASSAVK